MDSRILRPLLVATVLSVGVAACSGAPAANQSEPAGTVKAAMDAAQSGGVAKLADFACAAKKGEISSLFGGGELGSLAALGVDPNDVFNAVKMDFKDIQTTEKSKSGDNAVVHVTGNMTITIDPAKVRDIMKKMMEGQGQSVDDATLDAALAAMSSQLTQTQALDEDIPVVQEGGKWLICG
jgi:hypothetical protein